ncbi:MULTISPECIES: M48 family metalloprotease [unclassified Frankia]|uniref:M48 family metalloprotease n=1 Tax=unclassified Frankia TaxID=2632575 RepID=UPI002AD257A9|nr:MULTISPECIES: M48 family metalloprotease [unclassified Frankia]
MDQRLPGVGRLGAAHGGSAGRRTATPATAGARRLPPRRAAAVLAAAAVAAGCGWAWDLALLAWTLIGQFPLVRRFGHWSGPVLAAHDPVSPMIATLATVLVVVAAATMMVSVLRCGRDVGWLLRTARHCPPATGGGLVVVDDPAPRALAVPGLPGRVVVTSSLLRALTAAERRVVFAHEHSHLRHAHLGYRLLVRLAAGLNPLLWPLVADCDYTLERWADEDAATAVADRGLAAAALARAALATVDTDAAAPSALAFHEHAVSRRVAALLAPPPPLRWLPAVVPAALGLIAAVCAVEAGREVERLFELAMHGWPH